ncbi:MAG TPA: hypothetical protein VJQ07_08035, partial [Gaiellaceae bacterium]|nr:hypothetical protein [Gaiellaceae bacterium]
RGGGSSQNGGSSAQGEPEVTIDLGGRERAVHMLDDEPAFAADEPRLASASPIAAAASGRPSGALSESAET